VAKCGVQVQWYYNRPELAAIVAGLSAISCHDLSFNRCFDEGSPSGQRLGQQLDEPITAALYVGAIDISPTRPISLDGVTTHEDSPQLGARSSRAEQLLALARKRQSPTNSSAFAKIAGCERISLRTADREMTGSPE
jgi:hypothetical protein